MSLPHTFPHKYKNDLMVKAKLKFPSLMVSNMGRNKDQELWLSKTMESQPVGSI